jgi:aldose 1-epimerase
MGQGSPGGSSDVRGFTPPRRQVDLQHGSFSLRLWPELGGSIAHFRRGGRDLFRPAASRGRYRPTDLACFPLLPYSNRVAAGRLEWQGRQYRLPLNVPGLAHPLHGIGWVRPWQVLHAGRDCCRIGLDHAGDAHWPWPLRAWQDFQLDDQGLRIETGVHNPGTGAMPLGLGQHPYLRRPAGTRVQAPVHSVWEVDAGQIPLRRMALPDPWDLRPPGWRSFDAAGIDHCFPDLAGAVEVRWPDGSGLRCSAAGMRHPHLILYAPAGGDFLCVEIVSHRPDPFHFRTDDAGRPVESVRPGETRRVQHRFDFLAPAS